MKENFENKKARRVVSGQGIPARDAKHSLFFNPKNNKTTTVPRHNEVDGFLMNKVLNDLGIEKQK